jgi:RHS repeat-associated protein
MRKRFTSSVKQRLAWVLAISCTVVFAVPAGAGPGAPRREQPTQTPSAAQRREIAARARAARPPDVQELSAAEMEGLWGRGQYRNRAFNGVLPWQKSFRDVNLCNGNLFKSFTDIQVSPARGAGLAFQRTYNSNDDREGPFGIGWTHAYDIRIEEAGNNNVVRTDFFGGKHVYHRDADGLYSPPPYLHDELSSDYLDSLANGPPTVLSDEQRGMDGTVKHFIANGPERVCDSITDRHGNSTTLTYGQSAGNRNLLTRVTDPSGRYLDLTWQNLGTQQDPHWRITQVQGPFQPGSGLPVYTVAYEYDGNHQLWKVRQDPNGLNRTTTYTYTTVDGEAGLLASITDGLGHAVSYTYARPQFNPWGTVWVTSATEPGSNGNVTWTFTPSSGMQGQPFGVTAASAQAGLSVAVAVDSSLRACFYGVGAVYLHYRTYDNENNITHTTRNSLIYGPDGTGYYGMAPAVAVNMTYGPHGNVLTESFSGHAGVTTTSYYDATKYFQKQSVTDANGNVTSFDYFDKHDANPGNRGQVKWVRDARYGVTGQQFEYTYNQYGQKLTETNLNDVATEYTYGDAWGNLTQVVQDPGMGGLNRTTTMAYDVAGRVTSSTDPKSQTSSFAYNAVGQPTQATLPGETVTYGYGANGRTESVTDGRGTTTIAYETGNDRVASVSDPVTGAVSYTYGPGGERLTATLPGGGTWTYTYATSTPGLLPKDDPNSLSKRLTKITDDQGRILEYWTDQYGLLHEARVNQTFTGGSLTSYQKTTYKYDTDTQGNYSRGALRQIKNTFHQQTMMGWTATTLVQNDYTHDNAGNRLTNQLSDNAGPIRTETYGYDALHRLTSVNYGDGQTQGYTFDAMGNRLTKTDNVAGNDTYSYNAANMLLSRNGGAYTNDANGNTLTGGGRTNTWDGQNRLMQCVFGGTTTTHTYGADGLRRRTVQGATTTDYVLMGDSVVRELRAGATHATYLHGPRGPEYRRDAAGNARWYLYDGLGSVLGEVDPAGNVTASRKLDVYGALRASTGTATSSHGFVGGLGHPSEAETGLVYMRARYYDPVVGRFASEDQDRDGPNWFGYANANPVGLVDRSGGRSISSLFAWASAIYGAVAVAALISYLVLKHVQAKVMAAELFLRVALVFGGHATGISVDGGVLLTGPLAENTVKLMRAHALAHAQCERIAALLGGVGTIMVAATTGYVMICLVEFIRIDHD